MHFYEYSKDSLNRLISVPNDLKNDFFHFKVVSPEPLTMDKIKEIAKTALSYTSQLKGMTKHPTYRKHHDELFSKGISYAVTSKGPDITRHVFNPSRFQ